ncbi:MAG: cyclodeaminase/cyclohydrolase family protein [Oscillospiraceae bacterium]|nr:cyclodeaminase/cyclohydrolase family protein [Oscillospiraceae bacterium]
MKLIDMNLIEYLDTVASDAPAPGGGSASALCGAQGAGLLAMVGRLTVCKEKYAAHFDACNQVIADADAVCKALTAQIDIDTDAYAQMAGAFRLPKATDEEKAARKAAIRAATIHAAEVPLETMRLGLRGLKDAKLLCEGYNTNCASDVGCGVYGLLSCVRGAWLNVCINVGGLPGAEALEAEGKSIMDESEALAAELDKLVKAAISG